MFSVCNTDEEEQSQSIETKLRYLQDRPTGGAVTFNHFQVVYWPLKLQKRAGSQSMLNGLINFTYFTIAKMKFLSVAGQLRLED